jgi:hypothetical protein
MKARDRHLAIVCLGALLGACSSPLVRLGEPPPANIDRTAGRPVSASSCGFQLLQLIPLNTNRRADKALQKVRAQAGADYVGDVQVTEKWYYGVIGSVYCTQLDAQAYPTRSSDGR